MTLTYLNNEIDLAKKIFIYYTDKMSNYLKVGSDRYGVWYLDSLQLYFLLNYLLNVNIDGDDIYLGGDEIATDDLYKVFSKVREYWLDEIDIDYEFGEVIITESPGYIEPYMSDWKEFTIAIDTDRITQITLPVNITEIADPEAVILYVNDYGNPIPNTTVADNNGYHIEGNKLYWHNYYDLLIGDRIHVKYKQIVG